MFFFTKSYWCSNKYNKQQFQDFVKKESILLQEDEERYETVEIEREKILQSELEGIEYDGIKILGISKAFRKGTCRSRRIRALKKVYVRVARGELLALLGYDSAGKSTLINILTGILSCDTGTAKVYGMDLHEEMEKIQRIIGFVPEFDILWKELTAIEHLKIFAQLKGISSNEIPNLVRQKLSEVKLEKYGNDYIKTFSNGMKRRLSIAIATIGDPKIIIMDGPTVGIDTVNKRHIWKLINVI